MSIESAQSNLIQKESDKKISRTSYFVAMVIEIILLYAVNNILHNSISALAPYVTNTYPSILVKSINALASLKISFLTTEFVSCLWAVNLAITFAILGNLTLTLYHPRWFHHLMKGLILGVAILPVYVILKIFPFEFDASSNELIAKVVLFVIMGGLAVGFVTRMVLFVYYLLHKIRDGREKSWSVPVPGSNPAGQGSSELLPKEPSEPPAPDSQPPL